MIRALPKPLPRKFYTPKPKRLPERKPLSMTLVAAFRCRTGGVLLCADREENDGYNKREIDKIFRIPVQQLNSCDVWLAGAGGGDLIRQFEAQLYASLVAAAGVGTDVLNECETLIQAELANFHRQWSNEIKKEWLNFIVVVAPYREKLIPRLYRTNKTALVPYPEYCAIGSGQPIADYFANRLFHFDRLDRPTLAILAAFILREAEHSASGVGLGADMKFIDDGGHCRRELFKDQVKELQELIPSVEDAVYAYWKDRVKIPEWLQSL